MLLPIELLLRLPVRQVRVLPPLPLLPQPLHLKLMLINLGPQVAYLLRVLLGLQLARFELGFLQLHLLGLPFVCFLDLLHLRVLFGLLFTNYVKFALALAYFGLVVQLQVLALALLLQEHPLDRLELPRPKLFLLLVPLLFHLQALLELALCEGKRVIFLLLGEDVRAVVVDLAAQSHDFLVFERQVLLVLLDGSLVVLVGGRRRVQHLLRVDRLLRSLVSDTDMASIDGSLVHHLNLLGKRLLPHLMLHGLVHLRCVVAAVRQVDSIVDERLACYVDCFVVTWIAYNLGWICLIILLQHSIFEY